MARNQNSSQPDRAKVRIFYGEADGSSESIQDLVRLLSVVVKPPQYIVNHNPALGGSLPPPPANSKQADAVQELPLFDGLEEDAANVIDSVAVSESDGNGSKRRRRGEGPKVARNAGIELASGLDFVQEGRQSLKDFFAEKSPKKDMEVIVVFGYYMQEVMELTDFGPGHILSAFKHIGNLNVPLDLKATLRNMKKDKGWLTYSDIEHMRVDTEGGNFVKTELGKEKVKPR